MRPDLPEEEKVRFLQEAAIMGQFSHPYVVKLYGVVTMGDPVSRTAIHIHISCVHIIHMYLLTAHHTNSLQVMICIELMANGDLRGYLCSIVPK